MLNLLLKILLAILGASYAYNTHIFRQMCQSANNWKSLSPTDQQSCLDAANSSLEYTLAAVVLIFLLPKIKRLPLALLSLAAVLYGVGGAIPLFPHVGDWLGVFHGDFISLGAYQYALFIVLGLVGLLRAYRLTQVQRAG